MFDILREQQIKQRQLRGLKTLSEGLNPPNPTAIPTLEKRIFLVALNLRQNAPKVGDETSQNVDACAAGRSVGLACSSVVPSRRCYWLKARERRTD